MGLLALETRALGFRLGEGIGGSLRLERSADMDSGTGLCKTKSLRGATRAETVSLTGSDVAVSRLNPGFSRGVDIEGVSGVSGRLEIFLSPPSDAIEWRSALTSGDASSLSMPPVVD